MTKDRLAALKAVSEINLKISSCKENPPSKGGSLSKIHYSYPISENPVPTTIYPQTHPIFVERELLEGEFATNENPKLVGFPPNGIFPRALFLSPTPCVHPSGGD